jgi:hypothetical protein
LMNDSLMTDGSQSRMSAITMESARPGRGAARSTTRPMPPPPQLPSATTSVMERVAMLSPPPRPPKGPRAAPPQKSESESTVAVSNTARDRTTPHESVGSARSFQSSDHSSAEGRQEEIQRGGRSGPPDVEGGPAHGGACPDRNRVPVRRYSDQILLPGGQGPVQQSGPAAAAGRPPVLVRAKRKTVASAGASVGSGASERTSDSQSSFASSHGSLDLDGTVASGGTAGSPVSGGTAAAHKGGAIQWQRRRKPVRPPKSALPSPTPRSHSEPSSLMDTMMRSNRQQY